MLNDDMSKPCHPTNNGSSLGVADGLFRGTQGTMSHSLVPLFGSDVQLSDSGRKLNPEVGDHVI